MANSPVFVYGALSTLAGHQHGTLQCASLSVGLQVVFWRLRFSRRSLDDCPARRLRCCLATAALRLHRAPTRALSKLEMEWWQASSSWICPRLVRFLFRELSGLFCAGRVLVCSV